MASASIPHIDELPAVATLREQQEVEGVYACTRKERRISRAGTPYLTLELADRTGTISARAFRDADLLAGRFERGELVRVRGRVERFRSELQIALQAIASAPEGHADAARFLPVAHREVIVVDDGSTDGTAAIAEGLSERHADVRAVHHDVNRGYGAALRTGFAECGACNKN